MENGSCPDLLHDILIFFRMEARKTEWILEIPEGIFLVPYADILKTPTLSSLKH